MDSGIIQLIVIIYLVCHSPAFLMLMIGKYKAEHAPETAKSFYIAAGVYFLIGGGVCGALLGALGLI